MGIFRPSSSPTHNTPSESAILNEFASLLSAGGSEVTVVPEIQRVKFGKNMWNGVLGASAALSRCSLREFFRPPHLAPGREGSAPDFDPQARANPEIPLTESEKVTVAIPHASPAIGQYSIPFLYDALSEVYSLGAILFPPTSDASTSPSNPTRSENASGLDPEVAYKTLANTAKLHARPDSTHMPSMLMDIEAGRPMEVEHVIGEVVRMGRRAGVSMPVRLRSTISMIDVPSSG